MAVSAADITIERDLQIVGGSVCSGEADTEDGVGTEFGFGRSTVQLKHLLVDSALLQNRVTHQCRSDDSVDILYSLESTFAQVTSLVTVTKLQRLVLTGRCTRRYACTTHYAAIQSNFYLYGRIST